jgi:hypothetical protein
VTADVVKGNRRNYANYDMPVVVLALQDDGLGVPTPLSSSEVTELLMVSRRTLHLLK